MNELVIWPGWTGGALIGLYMLFQFWYSGIMLGCSGSYCNPLNLVSRLDFFNVGYYAGFNNWRLWFSIGLPIGGLLAAWTSESFVWHPDLSMGVLYDSVLPENIYVKAAFLFTGGIFMGLGSRLAGGCTSGHVISGVSLMNLPSLAAAALFFVGGIISVQILFALPALMGGF